MNVRKLGIRGLLLSIPITTSEKVLDEDPAEGHAAADDRRKNEVYANLLAPT